VEITVVLWDQICGLLSTSTVTSEIGGTEHVKRHRQNVSPIASATTFIYNHTPMTQSVRIGVQDYGLLSFNLAQAIRFLLGLDIIREANA